MSDNPCPFGCRCPLHYQPIELITPCDLAPLREAAAKTAALGAERAALRAELFPLTEFDSVVSVAGFDRSPRPLEQSTNGDDPTLVAERDGLEAELFLSPFDPEPPVKAKAIDGWVFCDACDGPRSATGHECEVRP